MDPVSLHPAAIGKLKSIISFCKGFSLDVLKVSSEHIIGADEVPSIVVSIESDTLYTGPTLFVNRLKVLDSRLTDDSAVNVQFNTANAPYSLEIINGRTTYDFLLASQQARLPAPKNLTLSDPIQIPRDDFSAIIKGAQNIGSSLINFSYKNSKLVASCSSEGERFKHSVGAINYTGEFNFNYTRDHLATIEKYLDRDQPFVFSLTPRGQMSINVAVDVTSGLTANVFILDVKNR